MYKLLDIILCSGVVAGKFILAIVLMMAIQLIAYQVFKVNPYKSILRWLNRLDKQLTTIF